MRDNLLDISDLQSILTKEELEAVSQILEDYASSGSSDKLDQLYYQDYDEIPVDMYTFLTDPRYLGKSFVGDDGQLLIYRYWVDVLVALFSANSQVMEVAFSGAIGLGKSTIACVGMAYILYKLLCLRDPATYYKLTRGSKIAIALFNINLDQGYGVGFAKLQAMLKQSPWFLDNGTLAGTKNPTYYPNKSIEIIVGSKMEHFIGRDVFCMSGDTLIKTENGYETLENLSNNSVRVYGLSNKGIQLINQECSLVINTKEVSEIYEIELEDGTVLRATGEHKLMISDGSYKRVDELIESDELYDLATARSMKGGEPSSHDY